ncbi:MAG: toll/interleukin-1 receptor domain-containing protein [Candidatus Adiutrix sp.]|jgi:hypothetical protein|nr:toll/interleukin-1 receptor domain-containing protein [Candidatus Adiutrix sp.]
MSDETKSKKSCGVSPCGLEDESFVFVSYAHMDAGRVFPIIESLGASGFSIWYDKGINISSTWTDEIAAAIMKCKIFIAFITRESVGSQYVRAEIEYALNHKIRIIPVYLDGMEVLPPGLALGLNSTQGITDTRDSAEIASLIREALDFNKVARKNENLSAPAAGQKNGPERPGSSKKFRLAMAAAAVLAVFAVWLSVQGLGRARGAAYSVSLAKTAYAPAEQIHINVSGLSQGMIDDGAIVGLCRADAPHGEFASSEFVRDREASFRLYAPLEAGKYEIRGYVSGNALEEATVAARVPITVEGGAAGAFSLEIDKREYGPGESIRTKVAGVPGYMLDDGAILGVYEAGAPHDKFRTYVSIRERDFAFSLLEAPLDAGYYEVRAYASWRIWADETLVTAAKFTVVEQRSENRDEAE